MKSLGTALAYAVYVLLVLLLIRWLKNNVTAKARSNYAKARQWATDQRAKMVANRPPDPPPSAITARVGAVAGGAFEAGRLAWRAGWPGARLGWPQGRQHVYDWWQRRNGEQPESQPRHAADSQPRTDEKPTDLTFCPLCGYDLARNRWPLGHHDPTTGRPCGYDYRTDPNWVPCPHCGSPYPPGVDECLVCSRRVAGGPTRFDPSADEPEPPTTNQPEETAPPAIPKGTPVTMPTTETIVEINTLDDLRRAAKAQAAQARIELDDAAAAVTRAKEIHRQAQTMAERAPHVLDNDQAAAASCTNFVAPAAKALDAARDRLTAAQATLDAAAAAQAALAPHSGVQGAVRDAGGRASSNTKVYA